MADQQANLVVNLIDKASRGIIGLGGVLAGLTAFLVSSTKAFLESEEAANKLNQALKNQGVFSERTSKDLLEYSKQLQNITTFSDEAIVQTEALLTSFGLTGQTLKNTTKAALDLSKGLGIDLRTATLILGKAFLGETGTLARYGIKIQENLDPTQKFAAVMAQVNQRFGGSAEAALNTYSGRLEHFKNVIDDVKEGVGKLVVDAFVFWEKQFLRLIAVTDKLRFAIRDFFGSSQQGARAENEVIQSIIDKRSELIESTTREGTFHTEKTQRQIEELNELIAKERERVDLQIANQEETEVISQTHLDQLNEMNRKAVEKKIGDDIKAHKRDKELQAQRTKDLVGTLNFISSLQSSKSKELAAIGKAAASAQALIDTYAAANVALKAAPPPFNFALAALVTAAGLANVARIAGVKGLAEGGIVSPVSGGTIAQIAEAGKPEAVIPLDDDRSKELLQDTLGGQSIVINVGTLIADDISLREFTRRIDRELFSLNRNKQSVALG